MPSILQGMRKLQAHMKASRELNGWIAGAHSLALLGAAAECGILEALSTPRTPDEVAAATHLDPVCVQDILQALEAHGLVSAAGYRYQLTPDVARLAAPDSAQPLADVVRAALLKADVLRRAGASPNKYTNLPEGDALAMARAAGASSLSELRTFFGEAVAGIFPEVRAVWQAGGRHLEAGCGVGNNLLQVAATFPNVRVVGIEIDAVTAGEAQRRTVVLSFGERVEVRCMDACDLRDEATFDTAQWSQFFFPEACRGPVLAAVFRAMKPGGYLFMPLLPEVPPDFASRRRFMGRAALRGLKMGLLNAGPFVIDLLGDTPAHRRQEARSAALEKLMFHRWGVPVRTASVLRRETEGAGFQFVRAVYSPATQFTMSRAMMLARKPASG